MGADDTDVEVPVLSRTPSRTPSRPGRMTSSPKLVAAREATGPVVGAASWEPMKARSLIDVQLRESAGRRGAQTVTRRLASEPKGRPVLVRIDLARSTDRDARLVMVGADSIVVEGVALGRTSDGRRPATLAVVVEGSMYSIVVEGGETAVECASRIARRLSSDFVVEVEGGLVRIVRER